jgi:hypothetical protein
MEINRRRMIEITTIGRQRKWRGRRERGRKVRKEWEREENECELGREETRR